jgi:flavin reductase (DIM6/NTAB) family NADH-FMN oxidoreductase RutF
MKLTEIDFNFADRIAKAALLTATDKDGQVNTMTVSWGGTGILWGREVAFVFVRPERHTFGFCESGDTMSLSFFGGEMKDTLSYCGTKSGGMWINLRSAD